MNYSTFYVGYEPPETPLDLLKGYDLEIVILTIVGLRNSLDKNKYQHGRDGAIESIIKSLPPERAKRLKYFIYNEHGFSLVQSAVIDKILVELFPMLKDNLITRELNDGQFEQRILDVLLSYNEYYYDNDIVGRLEASHELVWTLVMMQGVSRVSKLEFARTGLIKHLLMLDFLKKTLGKNFIRLQKSLRDKTGLFNIYYFILTFRHIFDFLENNNALVPRFQKEDPILIYLASVGLVINSEVAADEKFDIGMMLSKPFFETSSGDIFILDHGNFSFLVERAFMFMLYHKSDFPKLASIKSFNGLCSYFGKYYYEEFFMGKLLQSLQRKGVRVVRSDDNYLADFTLVVDEKDVFVFEVKSVAQHYRIFDAQNADEFRKHIDDHYLIGAGASQLDRYIDYIKDDKRNLLNIETSAKDLNIYPVIVVTDPKAATYGVNDYVGQQANAGFSRFKTDFHKVMPLTMIQSDFFVENVSLLAKDKTMLKKMIREYHFYIKRGKERCKKDSSTQNYIHSMISFDQFAIGRYGAFRLPPEHIHYHLETLFGLKDDD